jgi:hypothetical protein
MRIALCNAVQEASRSKSTRGSYKYLIAIVIVRNRAGSARILIDIGYRTRYPSIRITLLLNLLLLITLSFLAALAQWSGAASGQLYYKEKFQGNLVL